MKTIHGKQWVRGLLSSLVAGLVLFGGTSEAHARRLCVKWEIRTEDSGGAVPNGPNAGDTEDKYSGADGGANASALGVRVRISRPGWAQTYNTEPSTGCITWNEDNGYSGNYDVRVYGYQTDANDNYVRIHTGSNSTCSSYPGSTYSYLVTDYDPSSGTDTMRVGDEIARWTTQAMMGYSLYRYHDGIYGKDFHVAFDTRSSCGSSAHYGSSNSYITQGRHCLRVSDCSSDNDRRWKFIIAHEFGHALAAIHYGDKDGASNGGEPGSDTGWSASTTGSGCSGGTYSIGTVEWSSIAFREGFAHFIAGRVFNDRILDGSTGYHEGAFNWQGGGSGSTAEDLQRPNKGSLSASQSRYDDYCCTANGSCGSGTGAGIIGDWHRFLWDFYTNQGFLGACTTMPTKLNMLWLYTRTRLLGGLTRSNYFSKMQQGVEDMNLPSCLETGMFNAYADLNGIDQ